MTRYDSFRTIPGQTVRKRAHLFPFPSLASSPTASSGRGREGEMGQARGEGKRRQTRRLSPCPNLEGNFSKLRIEDSVFSDSLARDRPKFGSAHIRPPSLFFPSV
jgi:hypothetical protein